MERKFIPLSVPNFTGNEAHQTSGGAIYGAGSLIESMFIKNSATYGGAVYLVDLIDDCTFINNSAYSGGAVGIELTSSLEVSSIVNSQFINNSAIYGGAIISLGSDDEKTMAQVNITSCQFLNNVANATGGAIYFDGKSLISDSNFVNDSAMWGSAIYAIGYLDLRDSIVKSENDAPVFFGYHYYENINYYGDLYLKNNKNR